MIKNRTTKDKFGEYQSLSKHNHVIKHVLKTDIVKYMKYRSRQAGTLISVHTEIYELRERNDSKKTFLPQYSSNMIPVR